MTLNRCGPTRASVLAVALGLGACQSILPGDGPSPLAMRQKPDVGLSGQRLGPDGYPQLGAFPNSAAKQFDNGTVQAERGSLQSAAGSQAAAAAADAGVYERQLAELQAIKAAQRAEAKVALAAPTARIPDTTSDPNAVLREIEGLR